MDRDWPEATVKGQSCIISNSHGECNTLLRAEEDFTPALDIPINVTISKLSDYSRKRPATFEIEFFNGWDRGITVESGITFPFNRYGGRSKDVDTINLYPLRAKSAEFKTNEVIPSQPCNGIWRAKKRFIIPDLSNLYCLEPDESIKRDYALLVPPMQNGNRTTNRSKQDRMPTEFTLGDYTFYQKYCVASEKYNGIDVPDMDKKIMFQFTITLS